MYSQAKWQRSQTSAKPSPPLSLVTRFSKAKRSPAGSAATGGGWPSRAQRSRKWAWAVARSPCRTPRQRATKSCGVSVALLIAWPSAAGGPASPGATISRAGTVALPVGGEAPHERQQRCQPEERPQRHPAEPGEDRHGQAGGQQKDRRAERGAGEQAQVERARHLRVARSAATAS